MEDFFQIEESPEQHRFNGESYRPRTKRQIMDYIRELSEQSFVDCELPFRLAIRLKPDEVLYSGPSCQDK